MNRERSGRKSARLPPRRHHTKDKSYSLLASPYHFSILTSYKNPERTKRVRLALSMTHFTRGETRRTRLGWQSPPPLFGSSPDGIGYLLVMISGDDRKTGRSRPHPGLQILANHHPHPHRHRELE